MGYNMDSKKALNYYSKSFKNAIKHRGLPDIEDKCKEFSGRLAKMYESEDFAKHNVFPTIDVYKVYAVIAMCLTLKQYNLEKGDIIDIVNDSFRAKKQLFAKLEKVIDASPFAWNIARKWNINDHESRICDGSIIYDEFFATDDKVAYTISKCMYVEMFDYYGIKEYCKIFCMSDTQAYANLTKHVDFVRYSDLSDGDSCRDVISKKTAKKSADRSTER